jgi:hypothetical protein
VDAVLIVISNLSWVALSLSYGRRSVDQFVLVSGSPLGPVTRFYPYPFCSENCFIVLPVGRPLWREDGSVTYIAVTDWPGHCGPITIHYRLIWYCVPSSSPLTTRRDYGGGPHGAIPNFGVGVVLVADSQSTSASGTLDQMLSCSSFFLFDSYVILHSMRPLWRENGSVVYSLITH